MKQYDIIVIGGGPAGYGAALYAARGGWSVLVIEKMSVGGQMTLTHTIDNYPGFDQGIDGWELGERMQKNAHRFGAETLYATVLSAQLAGEDKQIVTDGEILHAKAVILATGAEPRLLGLPNEQTWSGRGVHYCAHCDGRFYQNKTVAVVGGGNSAVTDALYLSHLASKVYLIHRRDALRADRVYQQRLGQQQNLEILWNTTVEELLAEEQLTGVRLRSTVDGTTSVLSCDGLFVSIGRKPITEFLDSQLALNEQGYIIADESTCTSLDGVFAAGDVRTKDLRQVVTAVADGAVAAHQAGEYLTR